MKQSFNVHWEQLIQANSKGKNINDLFGKGKIDFVSITTGYQDVDTVIEAFAIILSYGLW